MEKKKTASAFVIDEENRLLCIYHNKFECWLQPGGHIEENESAKETAVREVLEETGIQIQIVSEEPMIIKEYHTKLGIQVDSQFLAIPLNLDIHHNHESKEAKWLTSEEIKQLDTVSDLEETYQKMLSLKRKIK